MLIIKHNRHQRLPVVALLVGASIWGITWYPYRLLGQAGISGEIATTISYFIALLLGMILFRSSMRLSQIFNENGYLLLWICFFAGLANIAYILAILFGEITRVLLLFYLAPLWTIFFSWLLLGEKLRFYGYCVIAFSLAGAATMLWNPENKLPLPVSYGDWMGLLGGFMYALVNVLVRKDQFHNVQLKSIAIWLGATIVGLGYSLIAGTGLVLSAISTSSWLIMFGVGLLMFVLSIVVQYGLTYVPANQAILILMFELVVAAITAYFLANEIMSPREYLGGVMIITASLFSAKVNRP